MEQVGGTAGMTGGTGEGDRWRGHMGRMGKGEGDKGGQEDR